MCLNAYAFAAAMNVATQNICLMCTGVWPHLCLEDACILALKMLPVALWVLLELNLVAVLDPVDHDSIPNDDVCHSDADGECLDLMFSQIAHIQFRSLFVRYAFLRVDFIILLCVN